MECSLYGRISFNYQNPMPLIPFADATAAANISAYYQKSTDLYEVFYPLHFKRNYTEVNSSRYQLKIINTNKVLLEKSISKYNISLKKVYSVSK